MRTKQKPQKQGPAVKAKTIYEVWVEGGLHERFASYRAAANCADKIEKEGWNVQIMRATETILGTMRTVERF